MRWSFRRQRALPAGVPDPVVEHRPLPPRQHRDRHEARGVSPVLEQETAAIHQAVEPRPVVRAEAAPYREGVGAREHADRRHLDTAHVLGEAGEPRRGEPVRARAGQMLAVEEERGHRAPGNNPLRHRLKRVPSRDGAMATRRFLIGLLLTGLLTVVTAAPARAVEYRLEVVNLWETALYAYAKAAELHDGASGPGLERFQQSLDHARRLATRDGPCATTAG